MNKIIASIAAVMIAGSAFADGHASGDAEAGEKVYKKCRSCHMIVSDAGDTIAKGGKTGPNLYGVFGRQPGTANFKFGKDLVAAGETMTDGWSEEAFVAYVANPKGWLKDALGGNPKSKMTFKLPKEAEARNVWAYLVSVGPQPDS